MAALMEGPIPLDYYCTHLLTAACISSEWNLLILFLAPWGWRSPNIRRILTAKRLDEAGFAKLPLKSNWRDTVVSVLLQVLECLNPDYIFCSKSD